MRLLSIAAVCGVCTLALAQTAAAAPPPSPWTGFYVGANFGYSWGQVGTDYRSVGGGGTGLNSDSGNVNGVIGGGQVGYNYRLNQSFLVGFEADIQTSGQRGSNNVQVCGTAAPVAGCDTQNVFDAHTDTLQWFGTVRGRFGYFVNPGWLVYGTGGLTYGKLTRDDVYTITVATTGAFVGTATNSQSATSTGWTIGGGVETALWGSNWTGRLEYLFISLPGLGTSTVVFPQAVLTQTANRFTDSIVRVGANYSFGPR
jgi:outer membrane immunogenic protein